MSCEHGCGMQATMRLRVVRQRFVAYGERHKNFDAELINGLEQMHVCIQCGAQEWRAVEEIER